MIDMVGITINIAAFQLMIILEYLISIYIPCFT